MNRELAARRPKAGIYWAEMGDKLNRMSRYGEALPCLLKARERGLGSRFFYWGNIGDTYYFLGMKEEAVNAYRNYLDLMVQQKSAEYRAKYSDAVKEAEARIREMESQ